MGTEKMIMFVALALVASPSSGRARQVEAIQPHATVSQPAWERSYPQDAADSLYNVGRVALRDRNFERAAEVFAQLRRRYPKSAYAGRALYWEAYALRSAGGDDHLRRALDLLEMLKRDYPKDVPADADGLTVQIQSQLARRGDADAAAELVRQAEGRNSRESMDAAERRAMAEEVARTTESVRAMSAEARAISERMQYSSQAEQDDIRMQALNALLQMDSENAIRILKGVLQNRSPDNVRLRRQAVFLVAQKQSSEREEILLDAVRNDPDPEVRQNAVFHLSQVRTPEAVNALDSILQNSTDRDLQERAIFALSQHNSDRAGEILRAYAQRTSAPKELRSYAIQWLGQKRGNSQFLRDIYPKLDDPELKDRALFALSQSRSQENADFLIRIALDESENIEVRKRALFWAGQSNVASPQLYELYDRTRDVEMKEQLIFVYAQRRNDSAALDKLIDIVRNEPDTRLKGRAIFWLGQIRDPKAIAVLEEIINR
jgi:HEAT repeat protein